VAVIPPATEKSRADRARPYPKPDGAATSDGERPGTFLTRRLRSPQGMLTGQLTIADVPSRYGLAMRLDEEDE
jgi:hypothetical protein